MNRLEIEQAITEHLDHIQAVVRKTLRKYGATLCESDAEDIDSNTVLCLLDGRMDTYKHRSAHGLKQWIGYIAMQRTIDCLRRLKNHQQLAEENEATEFGPIKGCENEAHVKHAIDSLILNESQLLMRARLKLAVASLSDNEQDIYAAVIEEDYSAASYSKNRGIEASATYTRRNRMIKNLRKVI